MRKKVAASLARKERKHSAKLQPSNAVKKGRKKRRTEGHVADVHARTERVSRYGKPPMGTINIEEAGQYIEKKEVKTARYELRFTAQQQQMMEEASSILGYKNASDYIRHIMQENATRVIKDQAILKIAEQDRQRFMDEIITPLAPGGAFKKAAAFFNKTFRD